MTGKPKVDLEERIQKAVREDIGLEPYNPDWPRQFELEATFLRQKLPGSLIQKIEHFGSTAVPGLIAKPIIDLLVQVSSLEETRRQIVPILEAEGYEYFWRTDVSPAYAWCIKRNANGKRSHHIHMVEAESKLWDRLYFRDYLREFPEEAQRYGQVKQTLAEKHPRDRIAYIKGKSAVVESLTEIAKHHYGVT